MLAFRCISGFRRIHTLRATGYTSVENKLHQLKIFTKNQPAVGVVHHLGSSRHKAQALAASSIEGIYDIKLG